MPENAVTGLPLWYQEGMAMFYSTLTVKGKSVVVGTMPKAFFDRLMGTGLMDLKRVLAVDEKSPEYNEVPGDELRLPRPEQRHVPAPVVVETAEVQKAIEPLLVTPKE